MSWKAEIERVNNGFILHTTSGTEEPVDNVYEFKDIPNETKAEQLALRDMFYYLMDYFAVFNDKHANKGNGQYLEIKVTGDDE